MEEASIKEGDMCFRLKYENAKFEGVGGDSHSGKMICRKKGKVDLRPF